MALARFNVPKTVQAGVPFEVKVLIQHPMESGQRRDARGRPIPRDIVHAFTCTCNGELVLRVALFPAIAANPFLAFHVVAKESGTLEFAWEDDQGGRHRETVPITVA
ncbi:thiosulfate oxidation carrier complex protein SoxZ [Stella sp.]|uniref:thiosulfate oxidation carrier complex protein SoxZ n=1 Tax=Stella sp. TaxID=2912054 RepID=UPI0035B2B6F8